MVARSTPEMTGAVADEARKAALRVPATHASPTDRQCISNRHSITPLLRPCPRPACPTGRHPGLVASDFSNRNIPLLEDPQVHENKG